MKLVTVAAGGTGGHVIPAQVVAEDLVTCGVACSFIAHGLKTNLCLDRSKWVHDDVPAAPICLSAGGIVQFVTKNIHGLARSIALLQKKPCVAVVGFGSYHVAPVLAAAVFLRIPLFLYEANAVPGRVTRLFAPFARCTGCFFQDAVERLGKKAVLVGHPLRKRVQERIPQELARNHYGLSSSKRVLLVLGGSQGASFFNALIPEAVGLLPQKPEVLHLAGRLADTGAINDRYAKLGIHAIVLEFESDMHYALSAADCVISRSGASAVAEIEDRGLPAIYVPYPTSTDDHQRKNAEAAVLSGRAMLIDEQDIDVFVLSKVLGKLIDKEPLFTSMQPRNASRGRFVDIIFDAMSKELS